MMHIESLRRGTEFKVAAKEHEAVIKCEPQDLVLIGKRKFAYSCPICGRIHTVPAYRVEEIKTYNVDVDLNDPSLPINIEKAEKAAAEKKIGNIYKRIKKLEKFVENKKEPKKEKQSNDAVKVTKDEIDDIHVIRRRMIVECLSEFDKSLSENTLYKIVDDVCVHLEREIVDVYGNNVTILPDSNIDRFMIETADNPIDKAMVIFKSLYPQSPAFTMKAMPGQLGLVLKNEARKAQKDA